MVDPRLPVRLESAGVSAELSARAAAALDQLVAARFGGTATDGAESVAALVDAVEACFVPAEGES